MNEFPQSTTHPDGLGVAIECAETSLSEAQNDMDMLAQLSAISPATLEEVGQISIFVEEAKEQLSEMNSLVQKIVRRVADYAQGMLLPGLTGAMLPLLAALERSSSFGV